MSNEFDIIQQYFSHFPLREDVSLGVGDDAALIRPSTGHELVITVDTLVAGVHFPVSASAKAIGFKSLAVNLSDLAAMGATPKWFTLALTLPEADQLWLHEFSLGLQELANKFQIALIGGDTTRGPLSITIQAMGTVASGQALQRSTAAAGDDLYVTGTLGDAGLGLAALQSRLTLPAAGLQYCEQRLHFPQPRVLAGTSLRPLASAMIDCSDGFVADLGHILDQSGVGAEVQLSRLPLSTVTRNWVDEQNNWTFPLSAGDDFELIFTARPKYRHQIEALADTLDCPLTRVGRVTDGSGLSLRQKNGELYTATNSGYLHFE